MRGCALKSQCTPSTERRVRRWEHEAVLEDMQDRLGNAPEMMRIRKRTVEPPFETLKQWMGATHFLTQKLAGVSGVMSLNVLAFNLKRVMKIECQWFDEGAVGLKRLALDDLDNCRTLLKGSDAILINYGALSKITQRKAVSSSRRQGPNAFLHTLGQKLPLGLTSKYKPRLLQFALQSARPAHCCGCLIK
jgi:hypothetical protein